MYYKFCDAFSLGVDGVSPRVYLITHAELVTFDENHFKGDAPVEG